MLSAHAELFKEYDEEKPSGPERHAREESDSNACGSQESLDFEYCGPTENLHGLVVGLTRVRCTVTRQNQSEQIV